MKPFDPISTPLAAAFIFTSLMTPVTLAQSADDWVSQTVGRYDGEIGSGLSKIPVSTTIRVTEDGAVVGRYDMNEQGVIVPGVLSECEPLAVRMLQCRWDDKYGTGSMQITFSDTFSSFEGSWSPAVAPDERYIWTGIRHD